MRIAAAILCMMLTSCAQSGRSESMHVRIVPPSTGADGQPVRVVADADGRLEVDAPAGSEVVVGRGRAVQPSPPKSAASTSAGDDGATGDTGDAAKMAVNIGPTFWVGLVLLIAGIALFLTKRAGIASVIAPGPTRWIMRAAAAAPKGMGIALAMAGGTLIILPWILDQIPHWVVTATVIAVIVYAGKYLLNLLKVSSPDA